MGPTTRMMGSLHQADGTFLVLESFSCPSGICYLVGEQPKQMSEVPDDEILITEEETQKMVEGEQLTEQLLQPTDVPDGQEDGKIAQIFITFVFTPEYMKGKTADDLLMLANNYVAHANQNYRRNNIPIEMKYHCHM